MRLNSGVVNTQETNGEGVATSQGVQDYEYLEANSEAIGVDDLAGLTLNGAGEAISQGAQEHSFLIANSGSIGGRSMTLNGWGIPISEGVQDYEYLEPDTDSMQGVVLNGVSLGGAGVPVSQGVQFWEYLEENSDSLGAYAVNAAELSGNGIPTDQRPKRDAGVWVTLQQSVVNIGEGSLIDITQAVNRTEPAGALSTQTQIVGVKGVGQLADLMQTVRLRASVDSPEAIASFDQTVRRQEASGSIFYLSQRVRDLSIYSQQFRPFEIDLTVAGIGRIPDEILFDVIEITREEDSAANLSFSVLLPEGDVTSYLERQGDLVILDYTDNATGKTERLFTGRVDIPEVDFVSGVASFRCSDNRKEAINALDDATVGGWGYWSSEVFGDKPVEIFDEVEDRLETIPYSLDLTRYGGLKLTAWQPKATPDKTLTDADVYRRRPSVQVLARGRVTNKVEIDLEFQYQRLRYREQPYLYSRSNTVCSYFDIGAPVSKEMIIEALNATTWSYKDLNMKDAACGSSTCGGFSIYRFPCGTYDGYDEVQKDADGNTILDSKGNPVTEFVTTSYESNGTKYTNYATWTSFIRFAQNISEKITLTVSAPQSIQQYGEVVARQSAGVSVDYDSSDWENMTYKYDLSQMTTSPNGDLVYDLAYLESANGATRWFNAYNTAVNRAKTKIIKSHRDNEVNFETAIIPDLELSDTVQLSSTEWTSAKGKVSSLRHTISMSDREAYTDVTLSLSRSIGTPPTEITPNAEAARPSNRTDSPKTVERIRLGYKVLKPSEAITEEHVGAIYKSATYNVLSAFAVNTPEIVEARDNREYTNEISVEIPIRNDQMTIRHKR